MRLGFLVNPISGMGGAVGLKGTDGHLYQEALRRGAKPVAPSRALRFVKALRKIGFTGEVVAANCVMGCDYFEGSGIKHACIPVPEECERTSPRDTSEAVREFVRSRVDLIVFVGGDGTARDIAEAVKGSDIPILGIPAGVKMYSGVFAISPEAGAEVVAAFDAGRAEVEVSEVADVDESSLNEGVIRVRRYELVRTPKITGLVTPTKNFGGGDEGSKEAIAEYFVEEYIKPDHLYFLGPGTTIKAVADVLKVPKTLLGVDAFRNGSLVGSDLGVKEILNLIRRYGNPHIVVTVIGAQGYLFGRGNQQFSSEVLKLVRKENIHVLATESKLRGLKYLLIDTGDPELDIKLSGHVRVITGYREEKVVKAVPACLPSRILS
ncbi:MAG: ATP-NAD kinase family protein [Desulfurococcales archaeon]|nr:ATP-NAD kinase family protein [Desulfurococcales archaeon]